MEENAKLIHSPLSCVYCDSILEVEIIGMCITCFQMREQGVLRHHYVTLSENCNAFVVISFHSNIGPQSQMFLLHTILSLYENGVVVRAVFRDQVLPHIT
jgi:hypothetical protein